MRHPVVIATALALLTTAGPLAAQNRPTAPPARPASGDPITDEGYVRPPDAIARLVTAPREANVGLTTPSPVTRRWIARPISDGLPSLREVGKPHHNLGGLQIDFAGSRERGLTMRSSAGLEVMDWETGTTTRLAIPAGARVGQPVWSPDGTKAAFFAFFDDGTQLLVAEAATGKVTAVTPKRVLATLVTAPVWIGTSQSLVTVLVPDGRGAEPVESARATGPMVRMTEGTKLKTRTYADLLQTPYEKQLLTYHVTGQLAVVDVKTKAMRPIGTPGMIRAVDPSPDGAWFRVTYMEEPFSYALPVVSFGARDVLLDARGTVVRELAKRPMRENDDPSDPMAGGARADADTTKRNVTWHAAVPGLVYLQLAPGARGGEPRAGTAPAATGTTATDSAAARRTDRVLHWKPPFDSSSVEVLYATSSRLTGARFNEAGTILFVTESGTGGTTEKAIFLTENKAAFTVIAPGARGRGAAAPLGGGPRQGGGTSELVTRPGRRGLPVVMISTDGKSVFVQGRSPDSAKVQAVHVDRIDIRTAAKTRIYDGKTDIHETLGAPLDDDFSRVLVQRESPTAVPQTFALTLASGAVRQLTQNADVMPELTAAKRRTVTARRADGYSFTVKVTLPADYQDGTRLPAMFWFYPREYDTQAAYDRSLAQGAVAERRFQSYGPRSLAFLVTQGYAVVEPDAPIFASEGQLPNDNYVVDLRNNLAAIIDALDTLAIIDRHRLGLGGHSYGAFSTVNAMVHTPFFKAGIAGDGAYNRTLTPNGFQSERRDLWQGRQTYLEMSPLLYADQLNGALLLYHSTEDQNVGTDPINSTRLYHALMGLGKTASLYMYPYEDHGPIARETVLDQWARWTAWLDKYVKNANRPKTALVP